MYEIKLQNILSISQGLLVSSSPFFWCIHRCVRMSMFPSVWLFMVTCGQTFAHWCIFSHRFLSPHDSSPRRNSLPVSFSVISLPFVIWAPTQKVVSLVCHLFNRELYHKMLVGRFGHILLTALPASQCASTYVHSPCKIVSPAKAVQRNKNRANKNLASSLRILVLLKGKAIMISPSKKYGRCVI